MEKFSNTILMFCKNLDDSDVGTRQLSLSNINHANSEMFALGLSKTQASDSGDSGQVNHRKIFVPEQVLYPQVS